MRIWHVCLACIHASMCICIANRGWPTHCCWAEPDGHRLHLRDSDGNWTDASTHPLMHPFTLAQLIQSICCRNRNRYTRNLDVRECIGRQLDHAVDHKSGDDDASIGVKRRRELAEFIHCIHCNCRARVCTARTVTVQVETCLAKLCHSNASMPVYARK